MSNGYKRNRKMLLIPILLGLALIAIAGVFVFYPMTVTIEQQYAPVIFYAGTNANKADLEGETITVNVPDEGTSAEIIVHPTYQTTKYTDILHIKSNTSSGTTYYVYIKVDSTGGFPSGATASLIIHTDDGDVTIDLTQTSSYTSVGTLDPGDDWQVDLVTYFPEGNSLTSASITISLAYTPNSGESP